MKYIIYLRVSTDLQDVRTQELECIRYINSKVNGKPFNYVVFSDPDTSSGIKMHKRLGLMDMLNAIRQGDEVVVYKLDRLCRDQVEMPTIYRMITGKKASLHSLHDPYCDEFTVGLMGVLAQREKDVIKTRVKSKLNAKRERGERISRHAPYGFELHSDGIHLKKQSAEQSALLRMCQWFDEGKSFRSIAKELTSLGYMNREGKPFQHNSIYRILLRTGRTRSSDQLPEDSEALLSHSG